MLRSVFRVAKYLSEFIIFVISHFVPSDDNLWVFTAGTGDRFAENPKYTYLYAARQEGDIRPVWLSSDEGQVKTLREGGYTAVTMSSWRGRYTVLRAGVICLSHGTFCWQYTGNSELVQSFHGNTLKTMGEAKNETMPIHKKFFKNYINNNWDWFVLTSDKHPKKIFLPSYNIQSDSLLITGYPRNDVIFRDIDGAKLCQEQWAYDLFESLSKKGPLLCYMPTWREAHGRVDGEVVTESKLNLGYIDTLLKKYDASLIIKLHPSSSISIETNSYECIYTISAGMDIYPVLNQIDVLITDYSSIYFDYLLMDRPIIFFPYDLEEYKSSRGFYFNYEEVTPGPTPETTRELHSEISKVLRGEHDFKQERKKVRGLYYNMIDGRSSERLYQSMLKFSE